MPTLFEEHLRHADPGRDVPAYTDAERRLLLADATADSRVTELLLRTPGRRWPRVAVAAAAGLTALGLLGVQLMGGVQPPLATAEEVLDAAAIHATDPTAADGQYWRITRSGTVVHVELVEGGGDRTYIVSDVDVHYRPVSGQGASWFVDGADAVERQVSGAPADAASVDTAPFIWQEDALTEGSWQGPTLAWLAALPRDPQALSDRVYADSAGQGVTPDDEAFVTIADVLRSGLVPADLRSALYQVLRTVPGVVVTEQEADIDGRTGVALGRDDATGGSVEIVIDPATGEVVGEREQIALPGTTDTVATQVRVDRAVVDSVPDDVVNGVNG